MCSRFISNIMFIYRTIYILVKYIVLSFASEIENNIVEDTHN